jgi:uncharacterized protein with FMN-binding domain
MPRNRVHPGLVALSASAITAIYVAGYVRTQPADAAIDAPTPAPVTAPAPTTGTPTPAVVPALPRQQPTPRQPAQPTPTSAPARAAQTRAGYKDGTYTGSGTSRRGDVWVSVVVQGGRITSVDITRSTLQYPLRVIANLPDEVVQRQSPQVDIVSRATYSSQAFRQAVSQALQQAV